MEAFLPWRFPHPLVVFRADAIRQIPHDSLLPSAF